MKKTKLFPAGADSAGHRDPFGFLDKYKRRID